MFFGKHNDRYFKHVYIIHKPLIRGCIKVNNKNTHHFQLHRAVEGLNVRLM